MFISNKIYTITFKGETTRKAYEKACKWVAKNIVSNLDKNVNIQWKIEKVENNTVELVVFNVVNISEEKSKFCKICKDYHKSFFINENFNCSRCNMITFIKRLEEKERISSKFSKEQIFK